MKWQDTNWSYTVYQTPYYMPLAKSYLRLRFEFTQNYNLSSELILEKKLVFCGFDKNYTFCQNLHVGPHEIKKSQSTSDIS